MDPVAVEALLDKQAITEVLMRYCRGVDRRDQELLGGVYWPDAVDDHVVYAGDAAGFIDFALSALREMRTSHMLANILIELEGQGCARSEAYYLVHHETPTTLGLHNFVVGGRFLDRFEKRASEWRIASRVMAVDFYTIGQTSNDWKGGPFGMPKNRGEPGRDDPLYRVFRRERA